MAAPALPSSVEPPFEDEPPTANRPAPTDDRQPEAQGVAPSTGGLRAALSAPVTVAGFPVPLWTICVAPIALIMISTLVLGIALGRSGTEATRVASSAPSSQPATPTPVASAPTVADATLSALESKGEGALTTAEVVTLAEGRREREIAAVAAFRAKLERDPRSINDRAVAGEFRGFLENRDTATPALVAAAALPGSVGPDVLYEAWTGTVQRTDVTEFARMLAYSTDVRRNASAALSVALDLRAATTCEQSRAVLSRAREQGDRRSLHLLGKLMVKSGCGPSKKDDCFPCLRDGDDLKKAIAAVRTRPAPVVLPSP